MWDGTGAPAYPADVLVDGARIARIDRTASSAPAPDDAVIDAAGRTLMPGLVEGHAHLSFLDAGAGTDLGAIPVEEHTLRTAASARTLLEHGFTSAFSAGSAKARLDVAVRNEIDSGRLPGPRLRACSPEITVTGGMGDENLPHLPRVSFAIVADGVDEIIKVVRRCIRDGVDTIKLTVGGDIGHPRAGVDATPMREDEVRAAVDTAHAFDRRVACHARGAEATKLAVRCGVDVVYHADLADAEAIDAIVAAGGRVTVGPSIGLLVALVEAFNEPPPLVEHLEHAARVAGELHRGGVRLVIGGDYGFALNPLGTNARDIEHFVRLVGLSPSDALQCATRAGAELMGLGHELGRVCEGFVADLLLVDGDPIADVTLLQQRDRIGLVMKDGVIHCR